MCAATHREARTSSKDTDDDEEVPGCAPGHTAKAGRLSQDSDDDGSGAVPERFRTLERDRWDAVVIGAGIGGLTAAALMARAGRSVLVLDQHYVAGGSATIFRRRGWEFDIGVHYLGDCESDGHIPRILRAAGVDDVTFRPMDPGGFDTFVFPELTFRLPNSLDVLRQRLVEIAPREAAGIDRYIRYLREVWGVVGFVLTPSIGGFLRTVPRSRVLPRHVFATLEELFDACGLGPVVRSILVGHSSTYGLPPSRASALYHAIVTMHYASGGYYPEGGGQRISDRLTASIERHGGKVLLLSRARRIVVEGGRVTGVEFENRHLGIRRVQAPVVVSNADIKRTLLDLVGREHLKARTVRRVEGWVMAPPVAALYLGVRRDLRAEGLPNSNLWWFPSHDVEAHYREVREGRPALHGCLTFASLKDPLNPKLAPPGHTNFQVMCVVPPEPAAWGVSPEEANGDGYRKNPTYLESKERFRVHMLEMAERLLPGISKDVVFEEVSTPLSSGRYTLATGGTSYGIALTPDQVLHRRPGPRTEVRGLLLTGASHRYAHGVVGCMLNGLAAAAEVVPGRLVADVLGG
jgi:all-trans-retinol 13,14-reductase